MVPVIPDDPGDPIDVGPYRLLPFGYSGPSAAQATIAAAVAPDDFGRTEDASVIRASRIYANIGYTPVEFEPLPPEASTVRGQVARIVWPYDGPLEGTVHVVQTDLDLLPERPVEIHITACDASYYLESSQFRGHLMISVRRRVDGGHYRLYLVAGSTFTSISGDVPAADELIRMLESFDPPITAVTNDP